MRISLRCCYFRVAEQFADDFEAQPLGHRKAGERVPQIVDSDIFDTRSGAQDVPVGFEPVGAGLAVAVTENEIVAQPDDATASIALVPAAPQYRRSTFRERQSLVAARPLAFLGRPGRQHPGRTRPVETLQL